MSNDGYGEPRYPADPYPPHHGGGTVPPATPPQKPPLIPASQRGIFAALGAVVVAGLVVLVMAVAGVFSGDSGGGGNTPRKAVEDALYASKRQNLDDLKTVVCARDLKNPELSDIVGDDHAEGYSIGRVTEDGDKAKVDVRVTTSRSTSSATLPVVREDGTWKVCFSEIDDPTDPSSGSSGESSDGSESSDSPSPSFSISTPRINFCASATNAETTAKYFASFVGLQLTTQAASCVYDNRLSSSDIQGLTGDIYSPEQVTSSGSTYSFRAATGSSTLDVVVEQQSDGKYYVVAARKR